MPLRVAVSSLEGMGCWEGDHRTFESEGLWDIIACDSWRERFHLECLHFRSRQLLEPKCLTLLMGVMWVEVRVILEIKIDPQRA